MRKQTICRQRVLVIVALAAGLAGGLAASTLYSFGPDGPPNFVPRSFTSINTAAQTSQSLFNMGNGTLGFNGGVTFRPSNGLFYAIDNDSSGNSTLVSFSLAGAGAFNTVQALGNGFIGGLTFDTADNNFYGIALDSFGASTLDRIAPGAPNPVIAVLSLGNGFTGGLTFDSADGNLYAISNDSQGNSALNRISLAGNGSVTTLPITLGNGFLGGVAFDFPTNSFYALDSDVFGNSTLDQIILAGNGSVTPLFSVGPGFVNAGLTEIVPEPSALLLWACGAAALAAWRRIAIQIYLEE